MNKSNKIAVYLLFIIIAAVITEGCAASKDCGCGSDLNRVHKSHKRFH